MVNKNNILLSTANLSEADTGKKLPPRTPCICTDVWCWNWKRKSESLDNRYLNIHISPFGDIK